jgi:hypothetical protein
MVKKANRK